MAKHIEIGNQGENLAAAFLQEKNFTILDRNYRVGNAEVDIIAKKNNQLIFVEVKTRTSSYFGRPEDAVSEKKQCLLIEAAEHYCINKTISMDIRFDIVAITITKDTPAINHIENAFLPEW